MICPHETPGGSQRCPLCRHHVLASAGQLRPRARTTWTPPDPAVLTEGADRIRTELARRGRPVHDTRYRPSAPRPTLDPEQPTLDLED